MKTDIRSIFWFTGLLLGGITVATPNAHAQFTFITTNGAITITGYTGPGGAVTIPDTTNGLPVTGIGDNAFDGRSSLTSVTIPDSVLNIGMSAFNNDYLISSVVIGNGVTNIGRWAFINCNSLTNVAIPNSVITIGSQAFEYCELLVSVVIGNGVTSIPDYAFDDCNSLSNVVIGNAVTKIGTDAFGGYALTRITIPANVINVSFHAFDYCPNLTSAYFLGDAPPDDGTAFVADSLAVVYYLPGNSGWGPTFGGAPTALWIPAPHLDFRTLNHQLVLNWTNAGFTLQSAPAPTATFTNVPNATSPFTNPVAAPQQFFRLIGN